MGNVRALVIAALALGASPVSAQVWRGDFETADLSQFSTLNQTINGHDYITVVGDRVASGAHAGRIELHDDAVWPNGLKRVELHHSPATGRTADGHALYFAWSFYLPATLPTDPDQTIGYWESNTSYHQIMAFTVSGTDLQFYTQLPSYQSRWTGTGVVTPATWHRIAMHVVWSQSATTGRVDAWLDGTQVVTALAVPTLADTNEVFTQFGLLRGAIEFTDVPVIYIDDAMEGDSLADVHYDQLPTITPDAGMPDAGHDGGVAADAAVPSDAAMTTDAATSRDAGADAASVTTLTGGCSCSTSAPNGRGGWLVGLWAVAWVARKAKGRHPLGRPASRRSI